MVRVTILKTLVVVTIFASDYDLPTNISSTIRLYANDVWYTEKSTQYADDVLILQEDLSIIARWVQDWLMLLNTSKCEHLTITTKRNPLATSLSTKQSNTASSY